MALKMKIDERQTDNEIFAQYPSEKMKSAVAKKLQKKPAALSVDFGKTSMQRILSIAALVAFMVIVPVSMSVIQKNRTVQEASTERVKGTSSNSVVKQNKQSLHIYINKSDSPALLSNGDSVNAGDVIQLSYSITQAKYGMILSVDGNGVITQHYPMTGSPAALLESGDKEIDLGNAYELDDAPSFERFILVTSDNCFTDNAFESEISKMNKEQAKTTDYKKYFPQDAQITSILLLKQE